MTISNTSSISPTQVNKCCTICHTSTTPLWRVGPSGPKSLCNACGIKYNKKRRALLGLDRGGRTKEKKVVVSIKKKRSKMERKMRGGGKCNNNNNSTSEVKVLGETLKMRLMALEREMVLKRSEKNKLGEEEWAAAILLMALSYYA
ncbi:hypothetical protein Vadar_025772 [Vaccinium darrowii]|uniref:Uncharacterized protein n=1 Tax=Vaccinium darrowii TaxID=229202 RepID=A0ACB7XCS5_9ERIC|nr:hypothetical protein Vadar_025772 [Vaccinium darrowii]